MTSPFRKARKRWAQHPRRRKHWATQKLTRTARSEISDTLSAANSDDDLLDELDQDLDEGEKTGEAVADSLANIVNKRKVSEDKLKEKFDKYLRPSNCAALQVPLGRTMSADARKADIKASHVQKAVAKAGVALADSMQALLRAQRAAGKETKAQIQTAVQKNGDALDGFLGACIP